MTQTYQNCRSLTGNPVCGSNVTSMYGTYQNCRSLTGSPVCGDNVTSMYQTYQHCSSLTGNPVCGNKVTVMIQTYQNCSSLTGNPVCGPNVTNMTQAYTNCISLTGSPVCGNNVTDMSYAYYNCQKLNLAETINIGPNVTNMYQAFYNCSYNSSYFEDEWAKVSVRIYSPNVSNATKCFYGYNSQRSMTIYLLNNTTTLNTFVQNAASQSITGTQLAMKNDMDFHGFWYDTTGRLSIIPVDTVEEIDIKHLQVEGQYIDLQHGGKSVMEGVNFVQDINGIEYKPPYTNETIGWYFDDLASNLIQTTAILAPTEVYSFTHNGNTIKFEKIGDSWWCGLTMSGSGWTSEDYTGYSVLFY